MTHTKCIGPNYVDNTPRFNIEPTRIEWTTFYPTYAPIEYNAPCFTHPIPPSWADPIDISAIQWNKRNEYGLFNFDSRGYPMNPNGRTGMTGRGVLGKWGPNSAGDPLFTMWKRDNNGEIIYIDNLPVLLFVAIERSDGGDGGEGKYALPGGMVDAGEVVTQTIAREFSEEALGTLSSDDKVETIESLHKLINSSGRQIYKGYVDDRRNTDNAWMVTTCINVHDESGNIFNQFKLSGGSDAARAMWMEYHPSLQYFKLYASHANWVKKAYELVSSDLLSSKFNTFNQLKNVLGYLGCAVNQHN